MNGWETSPSQRTNHLHTTAIVFFVLAALLSAALVPNNWNLAQLLAISIPRAAVLAVALLFWVWSGKLDNWGFSRFALSIAVLVGVASLAAGCLMIQMTRDDNVPAPMPMVYLAAAALLPVCFMAGALLASRTTFLIASALAPIAGIVISMTWTPLNAIYLARLPETKAHLEYQEMTARKIAEINAIPAAAGLEPLLGFIFYGEHFEVSRRAQERIEESPDWTVRLATLLDGEHRLKALYVLTRRMDQLPDPVVERCWAASDSIAKEESAKLKKGASPKESEERMLLESVINLGGKSDAGRVRHWNVLAAVSEYLRDAKIPSGNSQVDDWVRRTQMERIPESAGIVPLLEFAGPNEAWRLRQLTLARIAKTPDSTTKLMKLLDGPNRVNAVVVLAERVDELSPDQRELCWRALAEAAKDMAVAIEQGKPPAANDTRKLTASAGVFWAKLNSDPATRLAGLAAIRIVVRASADEHQIAALAWADPILANKGK